MIWGENLRNVRIFGPGTLDGAALTRSSKVKKGTGDKAIALKLCENIEIRNLNIRQGGQYGGADKTVAADVVKEGQMMNTGQRGRESGDFLLDWQPIIWYKQEGRL